MLNKRIKSLLVAGLVILGMSGSVFAAGEGEVTTPSEIISTITNPEFVDGQRVVSFHDGAVIVTIIERVDGLYNIEVKWDSTQVKVTNMKTTWENGTDQHGNFFDPGYYCNLLESDGKTYKVKIEGLGGKPAEEMDDMGKLTKVEITTIAEKSGDATDPDDGNDEDEKNEEIDDNVETGDTSIMPIVFTVVGSAAGLFVLNKKDDEE